MVRSRVQELSSLVKRAKDVLRLNSPQAKIENFAMRLDDIENRLKGALAEKFLNQKVLLSSISARLKTSGVEQRVEILKTRLDSMQHRLQSLSIDNILKRGFSIVRKDGKIVNVKDLNANDIVSIASADAEKSARIID